MQLQYSSHSCNERQNMFPLHGCPLTLCSSGDSLSGNSLTASLEGGWRKESRLQHRRPLPGPKSELTREGNIKTACILSLLCSLDIQAVVQTPGVEHLDIAANKSTFYCQCHDVSVHWRSGVLWSLSPERGWDAANSR